MSLWSSKFWFYAFSSCVVSEFRVNSPPEAQTLWPNFRRRFPFVLQKRESTPFAEFCASHEQGLSSVFIGDPYTSISRGAADSSRTQPLLSPFRRREK